MSNGIGHVCDGTASPEEVAVGAPSPLALVARLQRQAHPESAGDKGHGNVECWIPALPGNKRKPERWVAFTLGCPGHVAAASDRSVQTHLTTTLAHELAPRVTFEETMTILSQHACASDNEGWRPIAAGVGGPAAEATASGDCGRQG